VASKPRIKAAKSKMDTKLAGLRRKVTAQSRSDWIKVKGSRYFRTEQKDIPPSRAPRLRPAGLVFPFTSFQGIMISGAARCTQMLNILTMTQLLRSNRASLVSRLSQDRFHSYSPHRQIEYTFFREDLVDLEKEQVMAISDFCFDKIMGLQDK
jgi:hypothetical protein